MAETDQKIKVMSSVQEEDRASVYDKLLEHLGQLIPIHTSPEETVASVHAPKIRIIKRAVLLKP